MYRPCLAICATLAFTACKANNLRFNLERATGTSAGSDELFDDGATRPSEGGTSGGDDRVGDGDDATGASIQMDATEAGDRGDLSSQILADEGSDEVETGMTEVSGSTGASDEAESTGEADTRTGELEATGADDSTTGSAGSTGATASDDGGTGTTESEATEGDGEEGSIGEEFCPNDTELQGCYRFAHLDGSQLQDGGPHERNLGVAQFLTLVIGPEAIEPYNMGGRLGDATRLYDLGHVWPTLDPAFTAEVWIADPLAPKGQVTNIVDRQNHLRMIVDDEGRIACGAGGPMMAYNWQAIDWSRPRHIRCSLQGAQLTLWVDGLWRAEDTIEKPDFYVQPAASLMIGNNSSLGTAPMSGTVFGLRLWSRAEP